MATYRSLFISDVHLGLQHTNLQHVLYVLKNNKFDNLFLVGDIIDGWKLKRRFEWGEMENRLIQKIFKLARHGVKVHYIIGNHDEFLYNYNHTNFGGISVTDKHIHTTTKGEKILVIHGHQFDGIIKCNKWLQQIGSSLYEWLLSANVKFNIIRHKLGLGHWSLSRYIKRKTKEAVNYITSFENTLIDYAGTQKVHSVVCGHIHTPKILRGKINYYNTGDFVENSSFLVETIDGDIELIEIC